jgi:hypothetical protein
VVITAPFFYGSASQTLLLADRFWLPDGSKNPGSEVAGQTTFCMLAPNTCWSSVWILIQVTLLAARILHCLPDFWEIFGTLYLYKEFTILKDSILSSGF